MFNINIQTFGASSYSVFLVREYASGGPPGGSSVEWSSYHTSTGNDVVLHSGTYNTALNAGDKLYFTFRKTAGSVIQGINATQDVATCDLTSGIMPNQINSDTILSKRGKIKQWEFLKDLFTMFNLVVLKSKDNDTVLKIEPYDDIFIDNNATTNITPVTYDWTSKVDLSETKLTPIPLKQNVMFNYKKDSKDYATRYMKKAQVTSLVTLK